MITLDQGDLTVFFLRTRATTGDPSSAELRNVPEVAVRVECRRKVR